MLRLSYWKAVFLTCVLLVLGCARIPACGDESTVNVLKAQLSQKIADFVGSEEPTTISALATTDKGVDQQTHTRICAAIASTSVGAPTVTYTVARGSNGKAVVQISNVEPDQTMRDAAVTNGSNDLLSADVGNLKQIATAMEEYSVDHGGDYPKSLGALVGAPYLSVTVTVPSSGGSYEIKNPPPNRKMGAYEILDDGSIGAPSTLTDIDGNACDPTRCRHIIYAQSAGIHGAP